MFDLFLLFIFAALLNWAILDVYFYSILFEPLRQYGNQWKTSKGVWRYFRYALDCPHCASHWTAAAILAIFSGLSHAGLLPLLHPLLAILLIPAVARVSLVFRDYSLPPLINSYAYDDTTQGDTIPEETIPEETAPGETTQGATPTPDAAPDAAPDATPPGGADPH